MWVLGVVCQQRQDSLPVHQVWVEAVVWKGKIRLYLAAVEAVEKHDEVADGMWGSGWTRNGIDVESATVLESWVRMPMGQLD